MVDHEVIEKFCTYLVTQRHVAHNTFIAYRHDMHQLSDFLCAHNSSLMQANYQHIADFLHACSEQHMTPRARSRKLSTIKSFYAWAHTALHWPNPALTIPFPRLEKKLPNYLNEFQIDLLFKAVHDDQSTKASRNSMIVYILYATGIRVSELTRLKRTDIDMVERFIKITAKGSKERLVPFPQALLAPLNTYMQTLPAHSEYLFPVKYGKTIKPLSRQSCWLLIKTLCCQAGIKHPVSPHMLRHSLATHLLQKGAHLRALQLLLGHESINTVEVYTHVETKSIRKIYDKKHPRA
jgi:integrase/recombinase XerD